MDNEEEIKRLVLLLIRRDYPDGIEKYYRADEDYIKKQTIAYKGTVSRFIKMAVLFGYKHEEL